jgi:glycosyltransferase involved in cell wall biosynthesis
MPDMVSHQENGYLATAFDTNELAKGMIWVTEDSVRWKELSQAARSTVTQSFTLQQSASRYKDLYEEILDRSG